jgi:flavin reductase (DIM6/NTAB) family NADH-FMN oxidoreductase RutF
VAPVAEAVGEDLFKAALRRFASGITVVTCRIGDADHAMTASAFSAVSLDPPLVLVCVNRRARFAEALAATQWWGVSILAEDGQDAARWFATSGRPLVGQLDRFPHRRGGCGVALLDGSLATLECRTQTVQTAGDHDIVVGAVAAATIGAQGHPLLYWDGEYRRLDPRAGASAPPSA